MKKLIYLFFAISLLSASFLLTGCNTVKVQNIQLNQQKITLAMDSEGFDIATNVVADNSKLVATALPYNAKNRNITFSISDTTKAKIENNKVIPVAVGVTYITATTEDGNFSTSATIQIVQEKQQLSTVQNVIFSNNKIIWDEVPNADYYTVKINNAVETNTVLCEYSDFDSEVENSIQVQAHSIGTAYTSSQYSNIYKFKKLGTAQNIKNQEYMFTWDSVISATGYNVYLDNTQLNSEPLNSTAYNLDSSLITDLNQHTFTVQAVGDSAKNVFNSNMSEQHTFAVLSAPTTLSVKQGVIMFNQVSCANGYNIKIGDYVFETNSTSFTLPESIESGEHSVTIQAKGNGNYISSVYSNTLSITKLPAISGVYLDNNTIKWNKAVNAGGYIIEINGVKIDVGTASQFDLLDEYGAGEYKIRVACVGNGTQYIMSNYSSEQTYTKLETPEGLSVVNGKIRFNTVNNASGYVLVINGEETEIPTDSAVNGTFNLEVDFDSGNYNIKVKSIGDGNTFIDSICSASINTTKLKTPITPYLHDGIIKWIDVPNSYGYNVKINNIVHEFNSLDVVDGTVQLDLSGAEFNQQEYSIQIQAISNQGNINSNYSQTAVFKKHITPANIQSINGRLCFDYNSEALNYALNINGGVSIIDSSKLGIQDNLKTLFSVDLFFIMYTSKSMTVSLSIMGDDSYIASSASEPVDFVMAQPLNNLNISNNILSYTKTQAGNVLTQINGTTSDGNEFTVHEVATNSTSFNLPSFLDYELGSGTYNFTFRPQGDSNNILNGACQTIKTTILETPKNLTIKNSAVKWETVKNASGYEINIIDATDKTTVVKNLSLTSYNAFLSQYSDLERDTDYLVSVRAIGDGSSYISSSYTNESDYLTVNILETPTNVQVIDGALSWDEVEHTSYYGLYIDGVITDRASTSISDLQKLIPNGTHRINVYAYGASGKYISSSISESVEVIKLEAPRNIYISNGVLYCDYPIGATSVQLNQTYADSTTTETYSVDENAEGIRKNLVGGSSGYYTYTAVAIGDSTKYLTSNISLTCSTTIMNKTTVNLNNGVISWQEITGATSYQVYIDYYGEDGTSAKVTLEDVTLTTNSYTLNENYKKGYYKVSVLAIGDESSFITGETSTQKDIVKLCIPKNLDTYKGEIIFEALQGATAYNIYVDGSLTDSLQVDLLQYLTEGENQGKATYELPESVTSGTHTISIQAVGDDTTYATSDIGATVTTNDSSSEITGANIQVTKLDTVKDYRIENGNVKWTAMEVASGYQLQINDVEIDTVLSTAYYDFIDASITEGNKTVKVKAVGKNTADGIKIVNSNYTDAITAYKLRQVSNIKASYSKVNIEECGIIVWDRIENNNGYLVTVTDINSSTTLQTEQNIESCELLNTDILSGKVKISIRALGNSSSSSSNLYLSGSKSDEYEFYKLSQPTNFRIENGELAWDYDNGYKFVISITKNGEEELFEVDTKYSKIDTNYTAGTYTIKVKAQGQVLESGEDTIYQVNSSYTTAINAIKPEAPTNVQVDEYGIVTWDSVSDAQSYKVTALYKTLDDKGSFSEDDASLTYEICDTVCYLGASGRYQFILCAVSEQGLYSDSTQAIQNLVYSFDNGNGTADLPYEIADADDLLKVNKYPKAHFKQVADINLADIEAEPMFVTDQFQGVYDGQNFKIKNLKLDYQSTNNLGLFSTVAKNATIKNVQIIDVNVSLGSSKVGILTGNNYGTIQNCSVTGNVTATTLSTNNSTELNIGGIAGYNSEDAKVIRCYSDVTIKAVIVNTTTATRCAVISGGIVGSNYGTIYQCYTGSNGTVYGHTAGGIAGVNANRVEQCYNNLSVSATNITFQSVERNGYAGGIVGLNANTTNTLIYNCYNLGEITCSDNKNVTTNGYSLYAGGIAARNNAGTSTQAKIINCYNAGNIPAGTTNGYGYYNTAICYNDNLGYINFVYSISGTTAVNGGDRNVSNNIQDNINYLQSSEFVNVLNNNINSLTQDATLSDFNLQSETVWVLISSDNNAITGFVWQTE